MKNEPKKAVLLPDEFNPYQYFNSFWQVPKEIASHEGLSLGAKLLYGVLIGLCGKYGTAYPSHEKLRSMLGITGEKRLYRWQRELEVANLIRVNQKGRGESNNYYFRRSPLIGNAYVGEFETEQRYKYVNKQTKVLKLVNEEEGRWLYYQDVKKWKIDMVNGIEYPFPKPCWRYDRKAYGIWKRKILKETLEDIEVLKTIENGLTAN